MTTVHENIKRMTTKTRTLQNGKSRMQSNRLPASVQTHLATRIRIDATQGIWLMRLACCIAAIGSLDAWGQTYPNGPATQASPSNLSAAQDSGMSAELTRRLWESRISIPDPNEDADTKEDLKNLIEQIRSLKLERNEVTPSFSAPTDVTARTESNRGNRVTGSQTAAPTRPTPTTSEVRPGQSVSTATREKLDERLQHPDRVRNPLEVAELLFLSGYLVEAIPFYEKALAQTAPKDPITSRDRGWILFQLGNCLRETDMAKARDAYLKLIAEYPDSPWTELAKAHGRLITWYLAAKPEQLMRPQPSQ